MEYFSHFIVYFAILPIILASECTTVSGPDPNKPCVFPFEYNGIIYHECTEVDHDQFWCHTDQDWGNCGTNCEKNQGIHGEP